MGWGEKSGSLFLVVRHWFQKVFWHCMGPLKENPTGYGGFHTLWAFLSHSTTHPPPPSHQIHVGAYLTPNLHLVFNGLGAARQDLGFWVSLKLAEQEIRIKQCHATANTISVHTSFVWLFDCLFVSECDIRKIFDTNEYPNIFVSKNLHEWMSEYIRIKNLTQTNVRINIRIENCTNIRIYSNIRPIFTL